MQRRNFKPAAKLRFWLPGYGDLLHRQRLTAPSTFPGPTPRSCSRRTGAICDAFTSRESLRNSTIRQRRAEGTEQQQCPDQQYPPKNMIDHTLQGRSSAIRGLRQCWHATIDAGNKSLEVVRRTRELGCSGRVLRNIERSATRFWWRTGRLGLVKVTHKLIERADCLRQRVRRCRTGIEGAMEFGQQGARLSGLPAYRLHKLPNRCLPFPREQARQLIREVSGRGCRDATTANELTN